MSVWRSREQMSLIREGVDYVNEGKGADVSITTDFKGRKADVSK